MTMSSLLRSQIGLHYNAPTLHLHSNTYRNGRYFLGLGHSFKKVWVVSPEIAIFFTCRI